MRNWIKTFEVDGHQIAVSKDAEDGYEICIETCHNNIKVSTTASFKRKEERDRVFDNYDKDIAEKALPYLLELVKEGSDE